MMKRGRAGRVASLALVVLAGGCAGYTHYFTMPAGSEDVKTVAIEIFKNKTLYTDIEFEFAQALEQEINAKTPLKIARRGQADSVITGSIDAYERVVLRDFKTDEVARYSIVLTVTYRFVRLPSGGAVERVIRSGDKVQRSVEFETWSNETEGSARAEAVRKIARKVVSHMFETW